MMCARLRSVVKVVHGALVLGGAGVGVFSIVRWGKACACVCTRLGVCVCVRASLFLSATECLTAGMCDLVQRGDCGQQYAHTGPA
jgi:hypothetical protein